MSAFAPCILIPTYNNPATIRHVVESVRAHLPHVVVVDDGSTEPARAIIATLQAEGLAHVHHRPGNGGKGAAVKTGFGVAAALGYTHALQVDADGQHTLDDIPRFLEAAASEPYAIILGSPQFDASAPRGRLIGRQLTIVWTHVETGGKVIEDPMCGFRVYPLIPALACAPPANRMDFDPEIAVRWVWSGWPVRNLPTRVRYISRDEGGVSHFHMVRDNVRISWMHTRLVFGFLWRWLTGRRPKRTA